jgi:large subunit ribosomal protein L19
MNAMEFVNQINTEMVVNLRKEKEGDAFKELPKFKAGDEIIVAVRVVEGEKERIQNYRGIVIGIQNGGISKSFTVRKISNGVGVERIFPMFSPMVQSIEIVHVGKVRRSKLYYLRGMSEKKIRQKLH